MGTGWRRAFCTTVPRDPESGSVLDSPSPRSCARLGFFSGGSNPSTPRVSTPKLRCRTGDGEANTVDESPKLKCRSGNAPRGIQSPKTLIGSNPSSPRSPLKLSLFRNSFKFRSSCGICLSSVKTGQGTAIYTAECSHAFHFPCIAAHVRKQGSLICPVCNTTWKDVPLLAVHKNLSSENDSSAAIEDKGRSFESNLKPKIEEKKVIQCSPRAVKPKESKLKPLDSRSYDDDEPLLTPRAGDRFIPIPEADENVEGEVEEDAEEFQGFFVNSNSSTTVKSDEISFNERELGGVSVRVLPETAVISAGRGFETYAVALRVKAPAPQPKRPTPRSTASVLDPTHRAPIDLVTVLDVSGSMTGSKLQMLKRAMRLVISSLGSADRLSIVAFSASPKRLLPLRRMTEQGQRAARRIIDRLSCSQGTSVSDALMKAAKVLEDRRERNPVASIMLLSDGQNERVQDKSSIQRQGSSHVSSTRFAHIEIPVHSFGLGQSRGYSHEPAEDAFAKCVGGLLSVVIQDLRIQLGFQSGSTPVEITAAYSLNGRPTALSSGSLRLGDLYAEEERELLVELKTPTSATGMHHLMTIRCLFKDPATQEVVYGRDQAVLIPPPSSRSMAPKIERLRYLFISTRAIAESRRLVEYNDLTSAHHLLASSRALLVQSNSVLAEDLVKSLEAELAELQWKRQQIAELQHRRVNPRDVAPVVMDENGEPLTPTSAWRAAEKLAKVAIMKKSMNRASDLHGFENARF